MCAILLHSYSPSSALPSSYTHRSTLCQPACFVIFLRLYLIFMCICKWVSMFLCVFLVLAATSYKFSCAIHFAISIRRTLIRHLSLYSYSLVCLCLIIWMCMLLFRSSAFIGPFHLLHSSIALFPHFPYVFMWMCIWYDAFFIYILLFFSLLTLVFIRFRLLSELCIALFALVLHCFALLSPILLGMKCLVSVVVSHYCEMEYTETCASFNEQDRRAAR